MLKKSNFNLIKRLPIENFYSKSSELNVYNINKLIKNFNTKRFFIVRTYGATQKGKHAHFKSKQLLFSISGKIKLKVTDTVNHKILILHEKSTMVYIPPLIWAIQIYSENSILGVFTDTIYNEKDYIRDYKDYKKIMNNS